MTLDFFIRRPIFSGVCSAIIMLAGALALPTLPVNQYPELAPPQVTVTSTYVGATSDVVENAVTAPLEQELNGVEGVRYMTSTSGNDGVSTITVTFEAARDIDVAAIDVQNRVARATAHLPSQVNQLGVVVAKTSTLMMAVQLFSPDDRFSDGFISNYADVNIREVLKRIKGVGDVRIRGERKFAMRLWLDPTQLARRRLTALDVIRALQEQNVQVAAGQVGQPPTRADQPYQLSVRAQGRLVEPVEFDDVVVQRSADGNLVHVRDVGRAELGAEDYGVKAKIDGHPGVSLVVSTLPSANVLEVRDAIEAEMARIAKQLPPGLATQPGLDTTLVMRASVREVLHTLALAIALVLLVTFLFLQGWRTLLITSLTMPVSLLGAFAFVKLFGFSINTLTLFGITLATGLVVDDAIVVIENIERLREQHGTTALEAAQRSMREVAGAVIAISVALIAVFLPVAFFPGTTGAIYRQFALTISASIAISTVCALTLTPALSALLLADTHGAKRGVFGRVDAAIKGAQRAYGRLLGAALSHVFVVTVMFVACLLAAVALVRLAPRGFVPDDDPGYFQTAIQGPEGMSVIHLEEVAAKVEKIVRSQPEVEGSFTVLGESPLGTGSNYAYVSSRLRPWGAREGAEHAVGAVIERIRPACSQLGEARVIPLQPPPIRGLSTSGGFQLFLEDTSGTRGLDDLAAVVTGLVSRAGEDPALRGVISSFTASTPMLQLDIDRLKSKALGVPLEQLFSTLQVFMGSQYVNDFNYENRVYRVYAQAEQQFRDSPQDIGAFYVRGDSSTMIPLDALVRVKTVVGAQTIRHYNMHRAAEVVGQPAPGASSGDAIAAMNRIAAEELPDGTTTEWSGLSLEQQTSAGQTTTLFALGLLFVFLVLAAQYESLLLPFVVILAVPVAVLGALGMQLIRGGANDVFCQVGLVLLVGLAAKNAILIVEFAEQLRRRGKSPAQAVVEAATTRLRPIVMTSIAFVFGVLPLMFATGAGGAARRSLGNTVFGGTVVSTAVNLFFIPTLYVLVCAATRRSASPAKTLDA